MVENSPTVQKTRVWSLGWEDPLEKGMATHSSILAWRISQTEEPGGLQSMGSQRVGQDWKTNRDKYPLPEILTSWSLSRYKILVPINCTPARGEKKRWTHIRIQPVRNIFFFFTKLSSVLDIYFSWLKFWESTFSLQWTVLFEGTEPSPSHVHSFTLLSYSFLKTCLHIPLT